MFEIATVGKGRKEGGKKKKEKLSNLSLPAV